ncbi:hypothetical protein NKE71_02360, partial [Streptococcus suis]|nr:hypothetical protein [Streptococcus suis]
MVTLPKMALKSLQKHQKNFCILKGNPLLFCYASFTNFHQKKSEVRFELLIFLFGLLTKAYYFSLRRRDATATVPNKAKPTNASADVLS